MAVGTVEQLRRAHAAELEIRLLRRLPVSRRAEDEYPPELLAVLAECREAHRNREPVRAALMLLAARDRYGDQAVAAAARSLLRARELEVLDGISRGLRNHQIGAELHLGVATVKTHLGRLLDTLGARHRAHAVAIGYRLGLLDGAP